MKRMKDMTEPELQFLMQGLAGRIDQDLRHCGEDGRPKFLILVFNDPTIANYVGSCHRDDMIRAMRECAARLESGNEVVSAKGKPRPIVDENSFKIIIERMLKTDLRLSAIKWPTDKKWKFDGYGPIVRSHIRVQCLCNPDTFPKSFKVVECPRIPGDFYIGQCECGVVHWLIGE